MAGPRTIQYLLPLMVIVLCLCLSHTSVLGPTCAQNQRLQKTPRQMAFHLEVPACSSDQDLSHADFLPLAFYVVPCASNLITEFHVCFPK